MPIKFPCECGKVLTAPDRSEGKRARCSACKRLVTIPAPPEMGDGLGATPLPGAAPAGATAPCPSCGRPLAAGTVLCVACGYDRRTRLQVGFGPRPRGGKRGVTFGSFPVRLSVVAGVAGLLVAGWFLLRAPLLGKMHMSNAVGHVTAGNLKRAITAFEELQPKLSGADRERVDLWLRQLPLEMEKNKGKTLDEGDEVKCDAMIMELGRPAVVGGAIVTKMRITNRGITPLTVRNAYFYLRGISDIALATVHDDNTLDGVVVEPGETREGKVVFRELPERLVEKGKCSALDTIGGRYFHVIFNDGTNYTKRVLRF